MMNEELESLKKVLTEVWIGPIKERFQKGLISYERQLQSELYHYLRLKLGEVSYQIWIEPLIQLGQGQGTKIPDLVITNNQLQIIAVIELKFVPWGYPTYNLDLEKLELFSSISEDKIALGWKPVDINNYNKETIEGTLTTDPLLCLMIVAKNDSAIFSGKALRIKTMNSLVLTGKIVNEDNVEFREVQ